MMARCLAAMVMLIAVDARGDSPRPWEDKTTQAQRDASHATFSEGNDLFFKRDYAGALARYERALAEFDHPRIRLAAAEVLVLLGRPADAAVHLEAAMRWGAAPFAPDEYQRAVELQKNLQHQLGVLVVRCKTDGAHVTLDGKDLLDCPGEARSIVVPGKHQIVGNKSGFLTATENATVDAAGEHEVDVTLKPIGAATTFTTTRRWKRWVPWALVAGAGGVALVGVPFEWRASVTMREFVTAVNACGGSGCPPGSSVNNIESRAKLESGIAISLWTLGGAIAVTGLVMVYVNREHVVPVEKAPPVAITPVVAPGTFGIAVSGTL